MATSIYINTDLKDLTANAVANINRPTQVVRLPQMVEGEVVDVVLHLVKSNGAYDSRSGTAVDVAVAISAKGKAATSGTFKLNAGIESTGNLSWNASAEAVAGALNALNGGSGAYGSKVSVSKLANGSYRVIFNDVGARVDIAGQSLDLAPESEVTAATSVVGSPTIRAQQVIEISQQPAIFSETWAASGFTWTGQLNANTARVQELIAEGADAFFEIKVGTDVVCQVPISILPSVAAPNSFPAHTLPNNLNAFAADPSTNGSFNPANWREDLSLVVGEDVQEWSTNLDEVAAKMSWNNQDLTFDIATGSGGVVIQVGQEVLLYCRNPSGVELVDGDVVKIDGATGGRPNIAKAIANNVADARSTIGVVTQTISNNGFGFIAIEGKVRGLSLPNGSFDEGDVLYLSDTTPGALTKIEPDISVEIGHVVRTGNNNGELLVAIQNEASLHELEQTLNAAIATKAPIASPTFTGNVIMTGDLGVTGEITTKRLVVDLGQPILDNIAIGLNSLSSVTDGETNVAIGKGAIESTTTGDKNIAIGKNSLNTNTTGISNVAIGSDSLRFSTTAFYNVAIGNLAMFSNTTGASNVAIGDGALMGNKTGDYNIGIGRSALNSSAFGNRNLAIGAFSQGSTLYGDNNVSIGGSSLNSNVIGNRNCAYGTNALNKSNSDDNVAVGGSALFNLTTGTANTAIGLNSLTGSVTHNNCTGLGKGAQVTGSNQVQLGNAATTVYAYGAVQNRSDVRDKADIRDTQLGIDFINQLRPVDFRWDMRDDYRTEAPDIPSENATEEEKAEYKIANAEWLEASKLENIKADGTKKRSRYHHGLIAQEVEAVLDSNNLDFGGFQNHSLSGGDDVLSVGYEELIAPLIKAVQQLSERVKELESKA